MQGVLAEMFIHFLLISRYGFTTLRYDLERETFLHKTDEYDIFYVPKHSQKNDFNKYRRFGITDNAIINPDFDNLCDEFIKELHKFEDYSDYENKMNLVNIFKVCINKNYKLLK